MRNARCLEPIESLTEQVEKTHDLKIQFRSHRKWTLSPLAGAFLNLLQCLKAHRSIILCLAILLRAHFSSHLYLKQIFHFSDYPIFSTLLIEIHR